jgi:hypothetical protein
MAPSSPNGVFLDATGKQWMISDILWTSRLTSMLLMIPLRLIAGLKISKPLGSFAGGTWTAPLRAPQHSVPPLSESRPELYARLERAAKSSAT